MRLHRFFIHQYIDKPLEFISDGEVVIIDSGFVHQLKDVFRMEKGQDVTLLDNTGNEYMANISEISKEKVRLHISEKTEKKKGEFIPKVEVTLCPSTIKKDNLEWVMEKGTELGVSRFVPILTERSEKKDFNIERAKKIIEEAAEQSGKTILPELFGIQSLEDALAKFDCNFFALDPTGVEFNKESISKENVGVFIGPEGGWTNDELEFFKNKNIPVYSLGKQILRAETASIAIASHLLL